MILSTLLLLVCSSAAWAGSPPTPKSLIINPHLGSGWHLVGNNPQLTKSSQLLLQADNRAIPPGGGHAKLDIQWYSTTQTPGSTVQRVVAITVTDWPSRVDNLPQATVHSLKGECAALGQFAASVTPVHTVPNAHIISCSYHSTKLIAAVTSRNHYSTMIESIGVDTAAPGTTLIEHLLAIQYKKLPPAPNSNIFIVVIIALVLLIIVLVGITQWKRHRQRRSLYNNECDGDNNGEVRPLSNGRVAPSHEYEHYVPTLVNSPVYPPCQLPSVVQPPSRPDSQD